MNSEKIKKIIYNLGADVCGISSVERFEKAPEGYHPKDILPDACSVIIVGKQFLKGSFKSKSYAAYTLMRNQLIQIIDQITVSLSFIIEDNGYIAVPIPSSEPYEYWDDGRRHGRGIISLKHSAQLAGIGSIGKNTLLINEKYGNRLWLGGVVTNLKLEPDPLTKNFCLENCRICIDACPQSALNEVTIDQKKCREIAYTSTEGGGGVIKCNLCRIECPFTML